MDIEKLKERKTDRRSPRGQFLIPVADQRRPRNERRVGLNGGMKWEE